MSYQIDKNLASSTLASSYTAGNTTLTLQAGDGAKFSASGDFVVALGTAPDFFLLCTSRSGDTLTVGSSGVEGTAAANESSGCAVTQVITSATLVALLAAAGGGVNLSTVVQSGITTGSSIATLANVTSGNLLIVTVGYEGGTLPPVNTTISDSLGSSFTMVAYDTNGSTTVIFFTVLTSSGANTISLSGGSFQRIGYTEVSGPWSTNDASGTSSTSYAQVTTTMSGDFIYAASGGYHSATLINATMPLFQLGNANGSDSIGHGCYIAGAARVYQAPFSNTDGNPATVVVAFK